MSIQFLKQKKSKSKNLSAAVYNESSLQMLTTEKMHIM